MSTLRCPSCGALARPDSPWCLLCYRDLRPAPPAIVRPEEPGRPARRDVPLTVSGATRQAEPDDIGWPCGACSATNGFDRTSCAQCGTAFMAALRAGADPLPFPLLGRLGRLSRGARLGIATGVGLLLSLLLLGATLLVGTVF